MGPLAWKFIFDKYTLYIFLYLFYDTIYKCQILAGVTRMSQLARANLLFIFLFKVRIALPKLQGNRAVASRRRLRAHRLVARYTALFRRWRVRCRDKRVWGQQRVDWGAAVSALSQFALRRSIERWRRSHNAGAFALEAARVAAESMHRRVARGVGPALSSLRAHAVAETLAAEAYHATGRLQAWRLRKEWVVWRGSGWRSRRGDRAVLEAAGRLLGWRLSYAWRLWRTFAAKTAQAGREKAKLRAKAISRLEARLERQWEADLADLAAAEEEESPAERRRPEALSAARWSMHRTRHASLPTYPPMRIGREGP